MSLVNIADTFDNFEEIPVMYVISYWNETGQNLCYNVNRLRVSSVGTLTLVKIVTWKA